MFKEYSNLTLSFSQIFEKFGGIYWNLILKYNLRQCDKGRITQLEQIILDIAKKYDIHEPIPSYESLTDDIMADITTQIKKKCKKYVVGALFSDTKEFVYSFNTKEEWLQFKPQAYTFICNHKVILEKLNYYEWARYLECVNDDILATKLMYKIDESGRRNNLSIYRKILYDEFETMECFYCGKTLNPGKIDVDHFIPWSFVKDDNLRNLVLACPECNRKKKDKLPSNEYLESLIIRNKLFLLDDCKQALGNYQEHILRYMYEWAKVNGYDETWKPKDKECKHGNSD